MLYSLLIHILVCNLLRTILICLCTSEYITILRPWQPAAGAPRRPAPRPSWARPGRRASASASVFFALLPRVLPSCSLQVYLAFVFASPPSLCLRCRALLLDRMFTLICCLLRAVNSCIFYVYNRCVFCYLAFSAPSSAMCPRRSRGRGAPSESPVRSVLFRLGSDAG